MPTLAIVHPKGGVGRSTTTYMLAVELARLHPDRTVVIEDRDQAQHLSRMLEHYPPPVPNVRWGKSAEYASGATYYEPWITLIDTAPEANLDVLGAVLRAADRLLVPVKGPEAGSVQVLPQFLHWFESARAPRCRLLGFLPTMWKPRRSEAQRWLAELMNLATRNGVVVFDPIPDSAAIAAWQTAGRPYAQLAREVADAFDHS
jgi:cellulose biosynthesis protein BcsQ